MTERPSAREAGERVHVHGRSTRAARRGQEQMRQGRREQGRGSSGRLEHGHARGGYIAPGPQNGSHTHWSTHTVGGPSARQGESAPEEVRPTATAVL